MNSTPSRRVRWLRAGREWVLTFLVMAAILGSVRSAVADWNDVPSGSMRPTILEGERIAVNRLAYDLKVPFTRVRLARWAEPARGDIVILQSPTDGTRLVKRVIGLPGDLLEQRDGHLSINGAAVEYSPIEGSFWREDLPGHPHTVRRDDRRPFLREFGPVRVPEGHYFVMGDNRDNSADSRVFGVVERDAIMGQVKAVVGSLDPERHYLPRWNRWFTGLE